MGGGRYAMALGDLASDTWAMEPMMLLIMMMRFNLLLTTQGSSNSAILIGAKTFTFMMFSHSAWRANMPPMTEVKLQNTNEKMHKSR